MEYLLVMELIDKDQNSEYVQNFKLLLDTTKKWGNELTGYDLEVAQADFMDELSVLYLDYFQNHIEEGKVIAFDYTETLLSVYQYINDEYVDDKYDRLLRVDPQVSSWLFACIIKTNIEAFNSFFSHLTGRLKDQQFENYLETYKLGADLTGGDIPENAPEDHWWWYA